MKKILCVALIALSGFATRAAAPTGDNNKGTASYYHDKFEGRRTANGEVFSQDKFTAASNRHKLGTYLKVTNLSNNKVVYVKINDRLAATNKRILDLAEVAAEELNYIDQGLAKVKVEVVTPEEGRRKILAQREARGMEPNNRL